MSATAVSSARASATAVALVSAAAAGGSNFEVVSDCRPYKFGSSDQCVISGCPFSELIEQSVPFSTRIFEVLGSHSSARFNRQLLGIVNLFLGEVQDYFVALVKDRSNNSSLFDLNALKAFYASKEWQVFTNPLNRQDVISVTILGVCAVSGVVSRYQTCSTVRMFRDSYISPTTSIDYLVKEDRVDEEEILNWVEMEIRTTGWCNAFSIEDLVVRSNRNPLAFLEKLERVFDRLVCPIGYERLGRFYADANHPLCNRNKAIYFYEKALRLMPDQPAAPNDGSRYRRSRLRTMDDAYVYQSLAEVYLEEGHHMDALQRIQTAMRWNPESPRADIWMFLMAKINKALGDFGEAQGHLLAILKREDTRIDHPFSAKVYIELAEISGICGRFVLAHQYLGSALEEAEKSYAWKSSLCAQAEKVAKELAESERLADQ